MNQDRFQKISNNYGELFTEVFAEQGLDYKKFEESVFEQVKKNEPNFREISILDIGVGDGETSEPFLKAGCKRIVGIDLNQQMLDATKEKFGDSIKVILMDAMGLRFSTGEFPIIITGATIHNILKKDRIKFWKELLRLSPKLFASAEKIADPDPEKHKSYLQCEVEAIKKVYGERHNLLEAEKEWLDHYVYDEQERLELKEIEDSIGEEYSIDVVFEMGLYKTVVATKK